MDDDWFYISEILPNKLYLGSLSGLQSTKIMEKYHIERVLSVIDCPMNYPKNIKKSKSFKVNDCEDEKIENYFEECFHFIDEEETPIFVHCQMGVSRSATIVIAYLMYKGNSLRQSYELVFNKRPIISPNNGFWYSLYKYAKQHNDNDASRFIYENWKYSSIERKNPNASDKEVNDYISALESKQFLVGNFFN